MNHATQPEDPPTEVLNDVTDALATPVTPLNRLPGGRHVGATRVRLGTGQPAVLKAIPRTHPGQLDEARRAQRIVEHMRARGYPTPAWRATGATATHVWHLTDFVDATAAPKLTPALVEQLMAIVELQADQASEPYDHWSYAWRVTTGGQSPVDDTPEQSFLRHAIAALPAHSTAVAALVERLRHACVGTPAPPPAPDMVHADLNPGNVLIRDETVVAVVDIGNAGSGTRATDLTTLAWHTLHDRRDDDVRTRLWTRILTLVGWQAAAVLAATHILHQLEFPIRHRNHHAVPHVVELGHRALDELNALR